MNGKASIMDATEGTPGTVVKHLAEKATIAGYVCQSVQLDTDNMTTVYYYSPKVRVDPERYANHKMGDWYTYLKASNGALPLKSVVTNRKLGFIMTSEATEVKAMPLAISEFVDSAPAR